MVRIKHHIIFNADILVVNRLSRKCLSVSNFYQKFSVKMLRILKIYYNFVVSKVPNKHRKTSKQFNNEIRNFYQQTPLGWVHPN